MIGSTEPKEFYVKKAVGTALRIILELH